MYRRIPILFVFLFTFLFFIFYFFNYLCFHIRTTHHKGAKLGDGTGSAHGEGSKSYIIYIRTVPVTIWVPP